MKNDLKEKAGKGIFWSAIDAAGAQGLQFAIGIILARLLLPEEFGLIGMLAIFMAVGQSFLGSGFGSALIQKKEITPEDTSSVFYFNLFMGLLLAGLIYMAAPWIASFYEQPILNPLVKTMSLVMVIGSFSIVQSAILTRNIDFKTQTKVSLIAGICSGTIGITMAYKGFGVWSLVVQQVSATFFKSVCLWLFNTWRPSLVFSFRSLRQMFAFGSRLLFSGLLNEIFNNIYYVVIGKFFTPAALGFYTRARRLQELPSLTLSTVVGRVTFPLFSSIQDDKIRLKSGLRKALCLLVFINTPVMVGLAVVAEPLVVVLLTEKWLPCVPYLQLLSILGVLLPLHILNLNVLIAMGRSDLFLRLEIIKKILIVINIFVTYRIGIIAMIIGQIVLSFVAYFLNSYYTGKLLDYSSRQQIRDCWAYLLCAVIMGAGVYSLMYIPGLNVFFLLLSQVTCGVILYPLLCGVFRLEAFSEVCKLISLKFNFL